MLCPALIILFQHVCRFIVLLRLVTRLAFALNHFHYETAQRFSPSLFISLSLCLSVFFLSFFALRHVGRTQSTS